jgi:hypothetical protein
MHGLILSYTEYRTLFLFEGLDRTSNRLIHFSRENWWRSMNVDLCVHSRKSRFSRYFESVLRRLRCLQSSNAQVKGAILKKFKKKKKREKISSASPKLCTHLSRDSMFIWNQGRVVQIEHIERCVTYNTGAN